MSTLPPLPTQPGTRVLKGTNAEAWREGFAFLQAAGAEAERVREGLANDVAAARREGMREGQREGERQAAQRLLAATANIDTYLAGLEPSLAELALGIAQQVLGDLDPNDSLVRRTRHALAQFRQAQALTLWVPMARAAQLAQCLGDLPPERLKVCGAQDLHGTAARLAGPAGQVDLALEAQLGWIRQALLPTLEAE